MSDPVSGHVVRTVIGGVLNAICVVAGHEMVVRGGGGWERDRRHRCFYYRNGQSDACSVGPATPQTCNSPESTR